MLAAAETWIILLSVSLLDLMSGYCFEMSIAAIRETTDWQRGGVLQTTGLVNQLIDIHRYRYASATLPASAQALAALAMRAASLSLE